MITSITQASPGGKVLVHKTSCGNQNVVHPTANADICSCGGMWMDRSSYDQWLTDIAQWTEKHKAIYSQAITAPHRRVSHG